MAGGELGVFILDGHPLTRLGVRHFLSAHRDLTVCGEAADEKDGLSAIQAAQPDVVVLELVLQGRGGVELIKDIGEHVPEAKCLVYTACAEQLYAERALRAGALGYVMKSEDPDILVERIRLVAAGHYGVSQAVSSSLLNSFVSTAHPEKRDCAIGLSCLTDRELQVFELIGQGCTSQAIATRLCLSVKTIDTYRSSIRRKLGLSATNGLIHTAVSYARTQADGAVSFGGVSS